MCRKRTEGRKGSLKELFRGGGGGGGGKGLSSLVFMGRGRRRKRNGGGKGGGGKEEREDRQGISSAFSSLFCSYVQHSRFHFYRKSTVLLVDFRVFGDWVL